MCIPVIAIDGPSASGKGTVAAKVAERLGFHYLDSGALYRLTALAAREEDVDWGDEEGLAELAAELPARFDGDRVFLFGEDVSDAIREEAIGVGASKVAVYPQVRAALLARQRDFCQAPGLVADGRDMGSVVFPEATLKIFLTASAEERALRRYKQLINKGESANLPRIQQDIIDRDARDAARPVAPLRQEPDAQRLDTTDLTIDQAVEAVLKWCQSLAILAD
jgi:cytidylate kinase